MQVINKIKYLSRNPLFAGLLATAIGGIIVTVATSYLTVYLAEQKIGTTTGRVVTRTDLTDAIRKAKSRIYATGYVLSDITPDTIKSRIDESQDFKAILVMVDPLGDGGPRRVICQRQRDEDGESSHYSDYSDILKKLREFREPVKTGGFVGTRLRLGVIDLYPTMTVMLIDDDLYAYFYPYGLGSTSPVIKFADFAKASEKEKDKRGIFFDDHLNKITGYRENGGSIKGKTKFLDTDLQFAAYKSADMNHPCTLPTPRVDLVPK